MGKHDTSNYCDHIVYVFRSRQRGLKNVHSRSFDKHKYIYTVNKRFVKIWANIEA